MTDPIVVRMSERTIATEMETLRVIINDLLKEIER